MLFYKLLSEILSDLDAQQRKELAALAELLDETELHRRRNAKKQLSTAAVFFIERSWETIAPRLQAVSLEAESGKSTEELQAYLESLRRSQPAYAWGWIRARMDARLMLLLEDCVPDLLLRHPEMAVRYTDSLRQVDPYWFRETPMHHLKAGYHTALGVVCKWYGSTFELLRAAPQSCPDTPICFHTELRQFASFSMTMLARTDRYLWDAAGAKPLDAVIDGETLKIAHKAIEKLSLDSAPDYGLRIGCPALRARQETGAPAFAGIIDWVETVFAHYLLDGDISPIV